MGLRGAALDVGLLGAMWAAMLLVGVAGWAQQPGNPGAATVSSETSELARDNLDRVAASTAQILAVLDVNAGLRVELKRWIAKDAADHGQIVEDSDLEDAAIDTRLAHDAKFRAAATRLLQGYGYLVANTNPNSEVGRERNALVQARIRRLLGPGPAENITAPCAAAGCRSSGSGAQADAQSQALASRGGMARDLGQFPIGRDSLNFDVFNPDLINPESVNPESVNPGALDPGSLNPGSLNPDAADPGMGNPGSGNGGDWNRGTNDDARTLRTSANPGEGNPRASLLSAGVGDSAGFGMWPVTADSQSSGIDGSRLPRESAPPQSSPLSRDSQAQGLMARAWTGSAEAQAGSFEAEVAAEMGPPSKPMYRSPYSDIPSVYDMYVQATAPAPGPVRRFGEDVFRNFRNAPPAAAGTIPIDFPASADYVVGPGDGLTIDLWGGVSQRLSRTVDREGRVSLPEVGPVLVNGQSLGAVQQVVQRLLRTQFHDVSADVSLSRLRTVRVYVVGEIVRPGAYDVSSLSTPLNALLAAGGPTPEGSLRTVKHYRGDVLVQQVDLYDLLLRGVRSDAKRLEPGDTLQVAAVGAEIRIDGMVRRPAIYELRDETTLAAAIDLAGGMLPAAALTHIEVQRLEAHEKRTMLSLDISGTSDAAEIEKQMAGFAIRDRDEIHVFPIATFNQDAVYLQGHVVRAGRYSYHPGMTLKDLVPSYADLLPEAAGNYAEIIRLNPPDYRPSVQSFDLGALFSGAVAAPALAALDTVRIFSRFDFENAPVVSVSGAVRHPGTFQTAGEIHLVDALQLSGGVAPEASLEAAQVVRVLPDSSLKILSVSLKAALAGDPNSNIVLQPRDRILIQKNILRADPPSLLLGGEVVNPGRYALTENLRVADLIRIAGGLKRSADGQSADLTQFAVSDNAPLAATHKNVNLAAALKGDTTQNLLLRDGDVLTVREVPGWDDRGAAIKVQGEAQHPGTYGIRPGERLSSVLERAGGFEPSAYPYGAILERTQVREVEGKAREEMTQRVQGAQNALVLLPETDARQKAAKETALQQWQSNLEELNANPPVGRVSIRISSDIARWKNTSSDIEVRAGDTLIIPKKPGYVLVSGQVFNATAIAYRPGRSAQWYLRQAGGPTTLANKKAVFVVRADGSVLGGKSGLLRGDPMGGALQAGDTVVVPEKALVGNMQWQSVLLAAQVAASIATTVYIAARY